MYLREYLAQAAATAACDPLSVPAADRCHYVLKHSDVCLAADGLIQFHYLEYCVFENGKFYITLAAGIWILALLTLLAKAANDFFCPALEVISETLKLPPAVAGATLLALGNGAPDVFIQLAATAGGAEVDREGVVIALTEPVGGGLFVTNVVLGAILLFGAKTKTVKLEGRVFLKDAFFYLGALLVVFCVIMTHHAYQIQGVLLILGYVAYVIVTLIFRERAEVVDTHDKHHTHIVHYLPPLVPQYIPDTPSCMSSCSSYSGDEEGPRQPLLQNMHGIHDAEHAVLHYPVDAAEDGVHPSSHSTVAALSQQPNSMANGTKLHMNIACHDTHHDKQFTAAYAPNGPHNIKEPSSPFSDSVQCITGTEPLLEPLMALSSSSLTREPMPSGHPSSPPTTQNDTTAAHRNTTAGVKILDVSSFLALSEQLETTNRTAALVSHVLQDPPEPCLLTSPSDTTNLAEEDIHTSAVAVSTQMSVSTEQSDQCVDSPCQQTATTRQLRQEENGAFPTIKMEQTIMHNADHTLAVQQYTSEVHLQGMVNVHSVEQYMEQHRHDTVFHAGEQPACDGVGSHSLTLVHTAGTIQNYNHPECQHNSLHPDPSHHHHHHHHHHHKQSNAMACISCVWEYICLPLDLLLGCTMPFVATGGDPPYTRWQATCLPFTIPLLLALTQRPDVLATSNPWLWGTYAVLATAGAVAIFRWWPVRSCPQGALNMVLAVLSFLLASVWMEQGADELVAVCSYLGTKLGISPSVLGSTVLAWGNALPDLVCNITMAREGFPTMALAAVFASPFFILSIGAGMGLASGVWSDPANMEAVHCPVRMVYTSAIITTIMHIILGAAVFKFNLGRSHAIIAVLMYAVYQAAYLVIIIPGSWMHDWCS